MPILRSAPGGGAAAPPPRTLRKEISSGLFLTRTEKKDAEDEYAVVYTLTNDNTHAVFFTMDFWGSQNFRLLPQAEGEAATAAPGGSFGARKRPEKAGKAKKAKKKTYKKTYKTRRADLLRKVVVAPQSRGEVARLKVDHALLPSHLKVHYVWEAASGAADPEEMPPEVGEARTHREMIAHGVHLVTTRTDRKDGHTKFVYAIDAAERRDSLQLTLDFSESENLALRADKRGFLARVFGGKGKGGGSSNQVPTLVKTLHLPAKTKLKKVATVRTVEPRKGWSLQHKISVEYRELVARQPLSAEEKEQEHASTAAAPVSTPQQQEPLLEPEKTTAEAARPAAKSTRRESVLRIRSSHGFQDGFLKPPATPPARASGLTNGWTGTNGAGNSSSTGSRKRPSRRGSFSSAARNSLSMLLDFIKPAVEGDGKTLRPDAIPQHEPTPPPYRMSWLSAEDEMGGTAGASDGGVSLLAIMEELASEESGAEAGGEEEEEGKNKDGKKETSHANLFELLSSLDLACHHASFVQQAMEDLTLLKGLATDSKADFRAALKEDVRVEKFGHREAILRAVLSN
jgi:hypothetical protein